MLSERLEASALLSIVEPVTSQMPTPFVYGRRQAMMKSRYVRKIFLLPPPPHPFALQSFVSAVRVYTIPTAFSNWINCRSLWRL